jgi:iron(III) transport system permease protein
VGRALSGSWRRAQRPIIVSAALLGLALCVLPPLLEVGRELAGTSASLRLLANRQLWWLLARSLLLSAGVTIAAVVLGVPLGALFARAELPGRLPLFGAHLSIVFLPPFLPALGWFHIFGRQGLLGSDVTADALFSLLGVGCVLTACFVPIVSAFTALGISGVDASLEDAGVLCSSPLQTATRVLVPCAAPVISLAALLVFALAFSELGVPMFASVDVYPTVVFARLGGMNFAPGEAAVFMLPLVLIAGALAVVERRFAGRRALAVLGGMRTPERALFGFRPLLLVGALLAALFSLTPIAALVATSVLDAGSADLRYWMAEAPYNSLASSAAAAVITLGFAVVLGGELFRRARWGVWSDALAMLAFLMPASILGIGLIGIWNRPATSWLYGSLGIVVIGFVARYSAVALRTYAAVLVQVPASLDDAARVAGVSYIGRLALLLRMTSRGAVGTFLITLLFALRDVETAILYYPPGGQPLTVRIFTLEANGPPAVVSALAALHVGLTWVAVASGALLIRRMKV